MSKKTLIDGAGKGMWVIAPSDGAMNFIKFLIIANMEVDDYYFVGGNILVFCSLRIETILNLASMNSGSTIHTHLVFPRP